MVGKEIRTSLSEINKERRRVNVNGIKVNYLAGRRAKLFTVIYAKGNEL